MLKGSSKIIPRKPIIDDIFADNDLGLHLFNIVETFTVYFNVNRFITPEYKVRVNSVTGLADASDSRLCLWTETDSFVHRTRTT